MKTLTLVLFLSVSAFAELLLFLVLAGIGFGQVFPGAIATNADLLVEKNSPEARLVVPLTSSATTIYLNTSTGFSGNMALTIDSEIIFCTTFSNATYTGCTRHFDGTTATAHSALRAVRGLPVAKGHNNLAAEIIAIETAIGVNCANCGGGGGGGGAPTTSKYITQTPDATLSAEQALSLLGTGILKNTTGTGVLSIAVAGDFPTLNQNTTGNAATATALSANPANCGAGLLPRGITAAGVAEGCAAVDLTADVTGVLPAANQPAAAADGVTRGLPAFNASDFDVAANVVSLDYTNGQKATGSVPGLLTSADWTTFNGKAASNASTTVNSQTCALGSICTVTVPISPGVSGLASGVATLLAGFSKTNLDAALTGGTLCYTTTCLPLTGGNLSGQLVAANLGIEFTESDTNPTCASGNFNIYADLSENKLKKCMNGSATDLDTTGGTPDFGTLTSGTNTGMAGVCGTGCSLGTSGGGTIAATTAAALAANGANCTGNNFALGVNAAGVAECAQPDFSNLSGTATDAQIPDTITASLYLPLTGGTLSGSLAGTRISSALTTVTFSATPTFNASLGNSFLITLTGNVTSSTLSNPASGQIITLRVCQDSTGSRTFVPPTNVLNMGTIDSTASACSSQTFIYDGTNAQAIGIMLSDGPPSLSLPGTSSGAIKITAVAAASGTVTLENNSTTVIADTGASNNFLTAISAAGVISKAQPVFTNISGVCTIAQGCTGTGSTLTGLVRGSASAMTGAELSGDVTTSGSNAVTIANAAVTLAKMANLANGTFICRTTAGTGVPEACSVLPAALEPAHTGDVTNTAGSLALTIANGAVSPTKQTTAGRTFAKTFNIENPATADSYLWFFEEGKAITLTRVACNVIGGTNMVINLRKTSEATSGSGGTAALTSNLTCTAGAMVTSSTFTSAGAATDVPVALELVSASGTNTFLHVTVEYTVD